jgi:hypothetical protein
MGPPPDGSRHTQAATSQPMKEGGLVAQIDDVREESWTGQ